MVSFSATAADLEAPRGAVGPNESYGFFWSDPEASEKKRQRRTFFSKTNLHYYRSLMGFQNRTKGKGPGRFRDVAQRRDLQSKASESDHPDSAQHSYALSGC